MSKCKLCNQSIILSPSAKDRAKKYGGKPSDYTKIFTHHSDCTLFIRENMHLENYSELLKKFVDSKQKKTFSDNFGWSK